MARGRFSLSAGFYSKGDRPVPYSLHGGDLDPALLEVSHVVAYLGPARRNTGVAGPRRLRRPRLDAGGEGEEPCAAHRRARVRGAGFARTVEVHRERRRGAGEAAGP